MDWFIDWLISWFTGSNSENMRQTIATLTIVSPPDLAGVYFQETYAQMWGLAIAVAIPVLAWLLAKAATENRSESLREFVKLLATVTIYAIAIPVGLYLAQMAAGMLTQISMFILGDAANSDTWFDKLSEVTGLSGPTNVVFQFLHWMFALMLVGEAFMIEHLILVTGTLIIFGLVAKSLGRFGDSFLNIIVGFTITSLLSKPVMVFVLVLGTRLIELIPSSSSNSIGIAILILLTLSIAAWVPVWLFRTYKKNYAHIIGGKTDASGSRVTSTGSGPTPAGITATAGGATALVRTLTSNSSTTNPSPPQSPQPGSQRPHSQTSTVNRIALTALENKAVQSTATKYPVAAAVLPVATQIVKNKVESTTLNTPPPPSSPKQATPTPPATIIRPPSSPPSVPPSGDGKPSDTR